MVGQRIRTMIRDSRVEAGQGCGASDISIHSLTYSAYDIAQVSTTETYMPRINQSSSK